jgi:iron complex transport system ATP-binding protein
VTLIGPNGAGKSTLLRALAGLVPFEGTIELGGDDVRSLARRAVGRRLAFVTQSPLLPPELTVREYVLLGRTPHIGRFGYESGRDLEAADRALHLLELDSFRSRPLATLSGGEQQRAVLARALAQDAALLLLDEPTSALDIGRQQQALELVDSLRGDGLTVVSTMHDLTLAGQYADRLVLLDRGTVVVEGSPGEVLSAENLSAYYGASVRIVSDDAGLFVLPTRG